MIYRLILINYDQVFFGPKSPVFFFLKIWMGAVFFVLVNFFPNFGGGGPLFGFYYLEE